MVYIRGNSRDYNDWEQMGNPTWGWNDVLKYFIKSEDMRVPEVAQAFAGKYHGVGGPLKVDRYNPNTPIRDMFYRAAEELGYKILPNIDEEFIGLHPLLATVDNNIRSSAARAFLQPIRNRTNLHIIKNAHVVKLDFNPLGIATGVQFLLNGTILTARQSKEIVMSAGAIGTPQILMLSGVGQTKHLRKLNIETVSNVPVGKNLQNHPATLLFFRINAPLSTTAVNSLTDDLKLYATQNAGPLTRIETISLEGYFNTVNVTDSYPDIQVAPHFFQKGHHLKLKEFFEVNGYDTAILNNVILANEESDIILFYIIHLNPVSRGKIKLRSTNPLEHPLIQSRNLKKPEDLQTLVRGINLVRSFLNTASFKESQVEEIPVSLPECDVFVPQQYLECYVRHVSTTLCHPAGTAKMGPATDRESVVDSRLRLRGVKGVRVIDASVMPKIVSGSTNGPTIMIGEKGSDFIKEDWGVSLNIMKEEL